MGAAADAEFSDFMQGRWAQLVRLGYGLTGDPGLAEDLAQTALARAYASWSKVRRAGNPDAYVRRIMIKANHSRFRKRRVLEQLAEVVPEQRAGTDGEASDDREALVTALMALPDGQRAVVVLRYWLDSWVTYDLGGRQLAAGSWPP
jgi:RNA polymerase sigma-70 factor (sigma-E family)